ncbi:DUF4363 family protein [Clostridium hydrogeniformans]|uniref:DUF4363 family protein n=1 Tax=Clostridium hydrogeniformans TaxID=349933 RepID=UPI00068A5E35|nr:DUF4363 family protein [Clostridium hydrogeniformans]
MKNIVTSFCIFISLLIFMTWSLNYLNKITLEIEQKNDVIEDLVNENKWEESYEEVLSLLDFINENSTKMSIFINHQEMDLIESEIYRLTQFVKNKNLDETLSSLHFIKFSVDSVKKLQKVNIKNIF